MALEGEPVTARIAGLGFKIQHEVGLRCRRRDRNLWRQFAGARPRTEVEVEVERDGAPVVEFRAQHDTAFDVGGSRCHASDRQQDVDVARAVGLFGLVQTRDGLVHRVLPGNHLGQADGRITAIEEGKISLIEIVPDGMGGFIERPAALALSE